MLLQHGCSAAASLTAAWPCGFQREIVRWSGDCCWVLMRG
jgi:hypothetical protein